MEHGNDEPSRPEGTGAFSSREDGPSECGPGTVRAVRDWIKKRLDLIRLCLEQAGESVRDLHGVALWLLVLILTVTGSVILVFSPFGSDSATRQPMVSEQRHQIVVPGGGQVQVDFEDVEHGLDQVSDVFHVPWYAFAGHVYARSRFW